MKLEGVLDGRVYCSSGRTVLVETCRSHAGGSDRAFATLSRLPLPDGDDWLSPWRLLAGRGSRRALQWLVGRYLTTNVWRFEGDTALATLGPQVFASDDGGASWTPSRRLPDSSGPRGVLPGGVCRHDGALYLGEYPLAESTTPRVLRSTDGGHTWQTAAAFPDVRHVHAVQSDPLGGDLWVTTGDRDDECQVGRLVDGSFERVGGGSQRWRTVELAFTPDAVLWGMDCVYAEANELLRLDRSELDAAAPAPRTVGTAPASVYHAATLPVDGERWVVVSTGGATGNDGTAPGIDVDVGRVRVHLLAASSASSYTEWHELATYDKRRCVSDVVSIRGTIPRANAYLFLESVPDRGLVVNPYNAVPGDGRLRELPPERFAELGQDRRGTADVSRTGHSR